MKSSPGPVPVTSAGDMSQATVTAGTVDLRGATNMALQAVWTGAPVGSLQLQGCLGYPTVPSTGAGNTVWGNAVWTNIGSPVSVSGAGNYIFDLVGTAMAALQLIYTKTSGTGTLTVTFNEKA